MARRKIVIATTIKIYFSELAGLLKHGYGDDEIIEAVNETELQDIVCKKGFRKIVFIERFFSVLGMPDLVQSLTEMGAKVVLFSYEPMIPQTVAELAARGAKGYLDFRSGMVTEKTVKKAIEDECCFPDEVECLIEKIGYEKLFCFRKQFSSLDKNIIRYSAMGLTQIMTAKKCNRTVAYIKKRKSKMYKMTNTETTQDLVNIGMMLGIIDKREHELFCERKYRGVCNAVEDEERNGKNRDGARAA